jgi:hypothetical protein
MRRISMHAFIVRLRPLCLILASLLVAEPLAPSIALSGEDVSVKNVRFEVSGNRILVTYDLAGPPDQTYLVKVTLKRRQVPSYEYVPKAVTGDVGDGKSSGIGRQVYWDMLRDYPNGQEGDDYYFHIEVTMISQGSNFLYYLGGGVAVAGTAAYLLLGKKTTTTVNEGNFPQPSGRPSGY